MERAVDDFEAVDILRRARREAVLKSSEGDISSVLASDAESPTSRVYVVKLLDVHPSLGKVSGRRLLSELGLHNFTRVRDLSPDQVSRILEACGEQA